MQKPLKVCIYGTGGIGKSELAANISQLGLKVLFFDLEQGSARLDVHRVEGVESHDDMRAALHSEELCSQFDVIVIDSLTKAEEWSVGWTIANVRHEKEGKVIKSIEDYGFGKGLTHNYETFLQLVSDLDAQTRRGRHVITIAHECITEVPNPNGENWIRYEPRLQSPASGKSSIRHRIKEWADHLLYVGYDVSAAGGKGKGSGSRAIYPVETPTHWAKSRSLSSHIVYQQGSADLWNQLLERSE